MQRMMKKIVALSVGVILSGSALANGFYVGAGLGAMEMKNKLSDTTTVTQEESSTVNVNSDFNTDVAATGTLLLGYSWWFPNKTFFALEAFTNATSVKVDNSLSGTNASDNSSVQFNSVYGLRVLPGMQVTSSTVAYGIVGYALAKAKIQNSTESTVSDTPLIDSTYDKTQNLDGYQLGVGGMTHLTDHLFVRGDLIYSGYQETDITTSSENGTLVNTSTLKPYTLEADLSLVYQFGQS